MGAGVRRVILGVLVALAVQARADELTSRSIIVRRPSQPISVDGDIDGAWNLADTVSVGFQLRPYFQKPPQHRTVARILSDEENLYCLILSYDDSSHVQRYTGLLDQANGDAVSLMIDTFNDRQTAYKFAVTASGVRADARMLDDARNRDYSWDGIWFAAAKMHGWGYAVEMQIPYKSIRYRDGGEAWGVDFDRWVADTKEDLYWSTCEQNEGQRVSRFGQLRFDSVRPSDSGLNLEIYPVALTSARYRPDGSYLTEAELGGDVFYNPSEQLTFQLTANPDFAQIEADPFNFNVSRYESYFSERRPFFTAGNEVFMPSGRQRNTGFYSPMELFYSRRIGKALPGGMVVPITVGAKATGRLDDWEYGGFVARTAETAYSGGGSSAVEPRALFSSARVKKRILSNSSIGVLAVAKNTASDTYGVIDIDGAFRGGDWQLAYQIARSYKNGGGDFAASAGFTQMTETWIAFARARLVGTDFDVQEVGFVPWRGTSEITAITGPSWFMNEGWISQILLYAGGAGTYEHEDLYTDRSVILGFNMQFRDNWGYEINIVPGWRRDRGVQYSSLNLSISSWFNISSSWYGNIYVEYEKGYNFSRTFQAPVLFSNAEAGWTPIRILEVGTSLGAFVEYTPESTVEEITFNARPFLSLTPMNNLNVRLYADNLWHRSTSRLERVLAGLLISYNFLPKSWVYLAINESQERESVDGASAPGSDSSMRVQARAAAFKVRYLYYL